MPTDYDLIKDVEASLDQEIGADPSGDLASRQTQLSEERKNLGKEADDVITRGEEKEDMQMLIQGITKALAGAIGQKKGMDLSGVEIGKVNWQDRIKNRLDAISQKRQNISQEMGEIRGARGQAIDIEKMKQQKSIANLKSKLQKKDTDKANYTKLSQVAGQDAKRSTQRLDAVNKALNLLADEGEIGEISDDTKAKAAGTLREAGVSTKLIEKIVKGKIDQKELSTLGDVVKAKAMIDKRKQEIYAEASLSGKPLDSSSSEFVTLVDTLPAEKFTATVKYGEAAPVYDTATVEKLLKANVLKEEKADTGVFFDSKALNKAQALLQRYERNPALFTSQYNQMKSKDKMSLAEYRKTMQSGDEEAIRKLRNYKIGVGQ